MGFLDRFKRRSRGGKDFAKQRLQLVLVQDRLDINSEELSSLKNELVETIARYLPLDTPAMEVSLRREGEKMALVANIPILATPKRGIET